MTIVFKDKALEEIYNFGSTADRAYAKYCRDKKFVSKLKLKIDAIKAAASYEELRQISPLHYERLKSNYSGQSSFRIGNEYVERVICEENKEYIELTIIKLDNTHYGNKK